MAILPIYALTVYEADDTTVLFDVSTDSAHARPYLKAPDSFPEQEIEFAKGAASIGQVNVQVVDVRTDPTDQDTGYLTGQLADANGYSQINGHRAVLTEDLGGGPVTVLDGVVRMVRLLDSFVTYDIELRDIRERERKTKAFETTDTPTILPRGVLNGYGSIPATSPLTGFYRADGSNRGEIEFGFGTQLPELLLTAPMDEALQHIAPLGDELETLVYDRWKVLWRDKAAGGAYSTLTQIAHRHASLPGSGGRKPYTAGGGYIGGLRVNNHVSGDTLPSNGQEIEVIVQYDGPPTPDWPYHLEGITVGELLRNLYRGDYSVADPRIRYDEAAVLALATPVRARIEGPVDDLRAWAEKHAYSIARAVPTLNADGEISPISYEVPDATVSLVTLNNSNTAPAGGGWSQGAEDAINLVRVSYKREYRVFPSSQDRVALSDQIRTVDVTHEYRAQASIDLLDEQVLEIESDLLRAIGTLDGGPLSGDSADETGAQVARQVARMATDRFVFGGQYFALRGLRSDSNVEALKNGSWALVGASHLPDYGTGERGANRLAQVVSRRDLNAAWCLLSLIDAGPSNTPLGQPTLGTVTADADGVVSVPVTALASGDPEARVDYAVNATEPASDSELWTFLDRASATPSTLTTPPLPAGGTAWVRSRSEAPGERPSAYTSPVSVAIPQTPRVLDVVLSLDEDGLPQVEWAPNTYCLGVEIGYELHELDTVPTFGDTLEADASDLAASLTDIRVAGDYVLSVQVTPYPGWTGSAVSGSPGPVVQVTAAKPELLPALTNAYLVGIPHVDAATGNRGVLIDLHYALSPIVDELGISYTWDDGGGPSTLTYDSLFGGGLAVSQDGKERLQNVGDFLFQEGYTDISVTVTPRRTASNGEVIEGTPVTLEFEDVDESGAGTRAALTAGGTARGDMIVSGTNVTIDADSNGRPRINASAGSVATLADVGDVSAYASLADGEVIQRVSGTWQHRTLAEAGVSAVGHTHPASAIVSGTLANARISQSSVTQHQAALVLSASQVQTGSFANARISQSSVTQHEAAINHDALAGFVSAEHINWSVTGAEDVHVDRVPNLPASRTTSGSFANARISQSSVTQHQAALAIATSQLSPGTFGGSGTYAFPGAVTAVGNITSNTSDERLKSVIGRVRWALPKLFLLRAIYYRWNALGADLHEALDPREERVGLFAQDVLRICPQAIRPSPAGGGYLAFLPEMLLPFVVQAIKELAVLTLLAFATLFALVVL